MGNLFEELKRRKVFRVAAVYAVVAWLLIQIADTVMPALQLPDWSVTFVTVLLILGFVPTLIAAWAYEITPEGIKVDRGRAGYNESTRLSTHPVNYVILAVVLIMAGIQIAGVLGNLNSTSPANSASPENRITRLSIRIPEGQEIRTNGDGLDISRDGTFFIYQGTTPEPNSSESIIWVRPFDSLEARAISSTRGAASRGQISPDGSEILFVDNYRVLVVPVNGGAPRQLAEYGDAPTWGRDGNYVYFQNRSEGISRVPAIGGVEKVITKADPVNGTNFHVFVEELPPGGQLLYQARDTDGNASIYGLNLQSGEQKIVVAGIFPVYSSSGHLLYQDPIAEGLLFAADFDPDTMELTSEPVLITDNLFQQGNELAGNVAVSDTGRLLYRLRQEGAARLVPTWISRQGEEEEVDPVFSIESTGANHAGISLSPDNNLLALGVQLAPAVSNIWLKELRPNGIAYPITFSGRNIRPIWVENGESLIYLSGPGGQLSAWKTRASNPGASEEVLRIDSNPALGQVIASSDDRWLVYRSRTDLYIYDRNSNEPPRPLIVDEFYTGYPALSADNRWLAYASDETGRIEIYVRPFPEVENGKWLVSVGGGTSPVWSSGGDELYYLNESNQLIAVSIINGETFNWGPEEELFSMEGFYRSTGTQLFDVASDGQRFISLKGAAANHELIFADNWTTLLRAN